jgi:hypothetical protein
MNFNLVYSLLFVIIIFISGFFLKIDLFIVIFYILLYPLLILTKKVRYTNYLIVSFLVSLVWIIIVKEQYLYNQDLLVVFGLNLLPLFSFSFGLFFVYLVCDFLYYKIRNWIRIASVRKYYKFLLFFVLYFVLLIFVETLGYHILEIKNINTENYAGLPLCDCIHAPLWMQIGYFLIGPIYFFICESYIKKRKNQNIKKKKKRKIN